MKKSQEKGPTDNAGAFLDNVIEFISAPEGLTGEEIKEYFGEERIDISSMTQQFEGNVQRLLAKRNREMMEKTACKNKKSFEEERARVGKIPSDVDTLVKEIEEFLMGPERESAALCFRNFRGLPYEDLKRVYLDFLTARRMGGKGKNDDTAR